MKETFLQIDKNYNPRPASREDLEILKHFSPNQILRAKLYGTRKSRSVKQNAWIHSIFRHVSKNTTNTDWDTEDKVKRKVKMAMKHFKDDVIVDGNKVYFELASFRFDKMDQKIANVKYEEAKIICALFLKVDPAKLEAMAIREG